MANEYYIDLDRLTLYDTQLKTYDSTDVKMNGTAAVGTSKRAARADHVHPTDTSRAPLASPTFTGTPKAPTAAAGTNTTQIATTAFVKAAVDASGGEPNQNAFSNVKVGSTTIAADTETDTLELVAGSNVTLTPDATNDKVTIAATDTTYSDFTGATASAAGAHGLVPAPDAEEQLKLLRGDGDWVVSTRALADQLVASGNSTGFLRMTVPSGGVAGISTYGSIPVSNGGTGATTLTGIVKGNGTNAMSSATASDVVSLLGTTAVNRATADASGNNIANTYLTQSSAESTYAKKTDISGIYKYKGSVATAANLPASPSTGDVYNIEAESTYGPAGTNVAWTGSAWDSLGGIFSISTATNAQIEALFA